MQVLGESPEESFLRPHTITRDIAEALMRSTTSNEVYSAIINTTSQARACSFLRVRPRTR